jgi:molecular chaperone DnaK (HSP70)
MEKDFKIFGDKNFSDLSQEIYENSKLKKTQIELLVQEVHGYIQGIEDIAIVGPILKELLDVGVKNDDNLLKLATVIQRIMSKHQVVDDSDVGLLSEDEKEELMNSLEDAAASLQKKSDDIDISEIKKKYKS